MPNLLGVWKSKDKRETRYINITRTDDRYAYGFGCDSRGRSARFGKGGRPTRVLLSAYRDGLRNYRRPEAPPGGPGRGETDEQAGDARG